MIDTNVTSREWSVSVQNRCKTPLGRCWGHLPDFWILLFLMIFNSLRQLDRHRQEVFVVLPSALESFGVMLILNDDFSDSILLIAAHKIPQNSAYSQLRCNVILAVYYTHDWNTTYTRIIGLTFGNIFSSYNHFDINISYW